MLIIWDRRVLDVLECILQTAENTEEMVVEMSESLDALRTQVDKNTIVVNAAIALIQSLKDQVAAGGGGAASAEELATVEKTVKDATDALDAAVNSTPPAPPTEPTPFQPFEP